MAFKLSPILQEQQFSDAGVLLSGGKIETYLAGSSTPATTYTSSTGAVAQANPIILNVRGEVANPIYLTTGIQYKLVLKDSANNVLRTFDNIEGVNDSSLTIDQWVNSGVTPVFVSATQFTVAGDQTEKFQVNRRVKLLVTAGTVYGYISVSSFAALTTITVVLDSGTLDSGLSSVQLGLITPNNTSLFLIQNSNIANSAITREKLANSVYGTGLKGAALASAATTNIFTAADGDLVHITGTTAITSFGTATTAGDYRKLVIDSAGVVITHGANLVCPEGVNIVTSAGDVLVIVADTTTQHRVESYIRAGTETFFGTFTRNMAAASTTQVITGVGFRPKNVRFYMGNTTIANAQFSIGEDNGTASHCVYDSNAAGASTNSLTILNSIRAQAAAGNAQVGSISAFSNDGFTIAWTLTGAGAAFTGTIAYVAEM